MKELQVRNAPKVRVLETEDAYHVFYVENSSTITAYSIHIPWIALFLIAAFCLALFFGISRPVESTDTSISAPAVDTGDNSSPPSSDDTPTDPVAHGLDTSGFVFPESSDRLLTEDDIAFVQSSDTYTVKELLRFAVNEIYARNGYEFATELYREFYRQFDWYEGGLSAEQAVLSFNGYERKNVDFLLSVEARYSP